MPFVYQVCHNREASELLVYYMYFYIWRPELSIKIGWNMDRVSLGNFYWSNLMLLWAQMHLSGILFDLGPCDLWPRPMWPLTSWSHLKCNLHSPWNHNFDITVTFLNSLMSCFWESCMSWSRQILRYNFWHFITWCCGGDIIPPVPCCPIIPGMFMWPEAICVLYTSE